VAFICDLHEQPRRHGDAAALSGAADMLLGRYKKRKAGMQAI
jgi:hypothetical protein